MPLPPIALTWIAATLLCVVLVELFLRLPLTQAAAGILQSSAKTISILSSKASDHWKEKAIGAYSRKSFASTLRLAVLLGAILALAYVLILAVDFILPGFEAFMLSFTGIVGTLVIGTVWAMMRSRIAGKDEEEPQGDYSESDKMLHRIALQSRPIANFLVWIDRKFVKRPASTIVGEQHVFVSGLARAGTTILMRRIHASGEFRSLTYRDMPFILTPNVAKVLTRRGSKGDEVRERAHGDRIQVNVDSPESLDEPYWRIFDGKNYIDAVSLRPHQPTQEVKRGFAEFVNAILSATGPQARRYLSKNNNNILRLQALGEIFPKSVILIPFRDPITHAGSLHRMHLRFVEQQGSDAFVREYMGMLAHHEFGSDHRPFTFTPEGRQRLRVLKPDQLDYWLEVWLQTYSWLQATAPAQALFICYEDLCADPEVWNTVARSIGIDPRFESDEQFSISKVQAMTPDLDPERSALARQLYSSLREQSQVQMAMVA